jgi:DNA-binding SARP family transcriptional activator
MVQVAAAEEPAARLALLSGFELRCHGERIDVPLSAQRLLAFLALHDRPLQRSYVAGTLWMDSTEERANASLRSALWRLRRPGTPLVESTGSQLALHAALSIDLRDAVRRARALVAPDDLAEPITLHDVPLTCDLLPDWYEDWVLVEREHFRQLRLHALERLCQRLVAAGRHGEAVEAGLAAVAGEPLRESAQRALIAAHVSEGNRAEAVRQFRSYRMALQRDLGVEPSPQLAAYVVEVTT